MLIDWRLGRRGLACGVVLLSGVVGSVRLPGLGSAGIAMAADAPAAEVDGATKKLMAANGLFQRGLFKLAATEYADFIAQNPQHAEIISARYALAICHFKLNDFEKAIPLLQQVTQDAKFEQRDEALAVLGHSELSSKHYDKAQVAFEALISQFPSSKHAETAALNRGQSLHLAGKYKEASEAFEQFIAKYNPSVQRPAALYSLALSRKALAQHEAAVAALEQLAKESPNSRYSQDAALLQGQSLEALGKIEPAIEQYRKMLEAAPATRKAGARYSLGVALYKAAKYDESAKVLAALLADANTVGVYAKPARLQMGLVLLAGGKTAEARTTLSAVAKDDADRAVDARYGLAQCDIADKKYEPARVILETLQQVSPPPANIAQISLDRAVCLMELGKFEDAESALDSLAKQYPKSRQLAEAIYRRAFCLHKLTKYEASHAVCGQVAAMPVGEMTGPAAELDAENLFLWAKYPEAGKAFESLAAATKDDLRRLKFQLRVGQAAHFSGDYPKAAAVLMSVAADAKTASTEELQPAIFLLGDALLQQGKNAEAAEAFGRFITATKGDKREAFFKRGLAQLRANDAGSEASLQQAAQGPADSPWVQRSLLELGQLQYKSGKKDLAAQNLNKVVAALAPEELAAPAVYLLGWIDFDAKHYPQAAERWKGMAEKYPKHLLSADATFQQGISLKEAGKNEEALGVFNAYASANPTAPNAVKAKQLAGECLMALGRNDQASAVLASLAISGSSSDSVLYNLAWSHRGQKKDADAEVAYRRLLKEFPESKLLQTVRGELADLIYNDKKYAEAVELLEPVVADNTAEAKLRSRAAYRLGWCYQKLGKNDKAAEVFAAFPGAEGDGEMAASATLQAGLAFAEEGKFDKAEKALTDAVRKFPQNPQASVAMLKLGEVQAELGKFDASASTYTEYLQKYPKDVYVHRARFGIGWSLENRKQFDAARQAYQKVIATNNSETAARAQFQIGETYLAEGKFEQGIAAMLAVEDVYAYPKWSARAMLEAGRAFEQLKQPDQAKQQYTQLVDKYKDAPEAEMARDRLKSTKG